VFAVLLLALIVPPVTFAGALALGRWAGAGGWSRQARSCWSTAALGLAYLAGHAAVACPAFPPSDVTDRIPWIAAIVTSLAVAECAFSATAGLAIATRLLALALVGGLILEPLVVSEQSWVNSIGWISITLGLCALAWANVWALNGFSRAREARHALILVSAAACPVLLLSGSVILGALGVVLCMSLITEYLLGPGSSSTSTLAVGNAVLTALLLEGHFYASLPLTGFLFLVMAPAGGWIIHLAPSRRWSARAQAVVNSLLVLVPLGIALSRVLY
jgi:hypothetical protein